MNWRCQDRLFGLALMGGVMLSSQEVDAQLTIVIAPEIFGGNKIDCSSSWGETETSWVVACDTCTRTRGLHNGSLSSSCKRKK